MADSILPLDTDFLAQFDLLRPAAQTGDDEAAAGLSSLNVHISATQGGAAIHASLSLAMTERPGTPGRYYAVFDQPDLLAQLEVYANQFVWLCITKAGDVDAKTYKYKVKRYS